MKIDLNKQYIIMGPTGVIALLVPLEYHKKDLLAMVTVGEKKTINTFLNYLKPQFFTEVTIIGEL